MRQLGRVLYITEPAMKLNRRGEALEAAMDGGTLAHIPMHDLDGIVSFSYEPATQAVMAACAERGIDFSVFSPSGRMLYRICGPTRGYAVLRREQYLKLGSPAYRLSVAKKVMEGKLRNSIHVLTTHMRRSPSLNTGEPLRAKKILYVCLRRLREAQEEEALRGIEGLAAGAYFRAFGSMMPSAPEKLRFTARSRRPPKDPCNVLLSLAYTMLSTEYFHALDCVGLDPYVGLLHGERPGKASLALDLMEELRPAADQFVLRLINLQIVKEDMFEYESGGVSMVREGRRIFYSEWERARWKPVRLPGSANSIERGLVPFYQAKRLADQLRGEAAVYEPFLLHGGGA